MGHVTLWLGAPQGKFGGYLHCGITDVKICLSYDTARPRDKRVM